MAKCVRPIVKAYAGNGSHFEAPMRMTDRAAFQFVERDGAGEYCPKSLWKATGERDWAAAITLEEFNW